MSVVVVATFTPKPENRFDVLTALKNAVEQVHDEDGCELYALHQGDDRLRARPHTTWAAQPARARWHAAED